MAAVVTPSVFDIYQNTMYSSVCWALMSSQYEFGLFLGVYE
jgi:hypothetical protein